MHIDQQKAFIEGKGYTHKLSRVHKKLYAPPGYIFLLVSIFYILDTYIYKIPVKIEGLTIEKQNELAEFAYNSAIKTLKENGKANQTEVPEHQG